MKDCGVCGGTCYNLYYYRTKAYGIKKMKGYYYCPTCDRFDKVNGEMSK